MSEVSLQDKIDELRKMIENLQHQLEQKEEIIKETRKYIDNHFKGLTNYDDLLQILDKGIDK